MAQALMFGAYLQLPLEAGLLTPEQAWRLAWDMEILPDQPWPPELLALDRRVRLFHLRPDGLTPAMQRQ